MVKSSTNLTRSGLRDYIFQRFSAVFIGAYILFLAAFILLHPHMDYVSWKNLFANDIMRIASLVVLLSMLVHTYIGMWGISTDYLTKSSTVRILFQVIVFVALIAFVIWGVMILWGL